MRGPARAGEKQAEPLGEYLPVAPANVGPKSIHDYDSLAKGKWISVLPNAEEYDRLTAQKAYFGSTSQFKFADGVLECRTNKGQFGGLRFPSLMRWPKS